MKKVMNEFYSTNYEILTVSLNFLPGDSRLVWYLLIKSTIFFIQKPFLNIWKHHENWKDVLQIQNIFLKSKIFALKTFLWREFFNKFVLSLKARIFRNIFNEDFIQIVYSMELILFPLFICYSYLNFFSITYWPLFE